MTEDELRRQKYQEVVDFIETYHRNLSKHPDTELYQVKSKNNEYRKNESR